MTFLAISCSSKGHIKPELNYDIKSFVNSKSRESYNVDVVLIHTSGAKLTWDQLQAQFDLAQQVYSSRGVRLNLLEAYKVNIPSSWHNIAVDDVKGSLQEGSIDFYDKIEKKKRWLSKRAIKIFNKIIKDQKNRSRTIYIITLNKIHMGIFDKDKTGSVNVVDYLVGALSFPAYIYRDRIPSDLRGVITLGKGKEQPWVMAHELAHKLINVSHEGRNICPKFSGTKVPGILGYEGETTIYKGYRGRWHLERLKKSPYLYKLKNGKKIWNIDYKDFGGYRDPIYETNYLTPTCSE